MYWFIILFPLLIYPWGYDPTYTMPKVIFLEIFVLSSWLYIIFKKKYWTINLTKPFLSVELIVVVLLGLIGISTIFSVNMATSLNGTVYRYEGLLTYFSYFSVFLFSYRLLNVKKVEKLLFWMATVSLFASIYGILQHYFLDFLPRNSTKLLDPRSYSFFDNANFFGSYLVLILLLTITLYLTVTSKKIATYYLITISFAFISLLFSQTRSGLVGLFCGIVVVTLFVISKRKYLWRKWATLLITLGLLMVVTNATENGKYFERFNSVFLDSYKIVSNQSTGQEGSYRFFIWKKSLPLIKEHFWIGSGPDTFKHVFPNDKEKKNIFGEMVVDKAHNEYLQIAVTLGVPALLVYLLLLSVILLRAFQAVKVVHGNEKIFLYGLISTIIGYLAQAFFNISVVPVAPLFWAILGITLAKSEFYLKDTKARTSFEKIADQYKSAK